jgi:hypothetical protein
MQLDRKDNPIKKLWVILLLNPLNYLADFSPFSMDGTDKVLDWIMIEVS